MSKYKIHIDPRLPDARTAARHRDFDTLYDRYQVTARFEFWRRLYRNPRFFAGLVAVVAVAFLVFEASETPAKNSALQAAPVAGPAWQVVSVPDSGLTLRHDSLRLVVPPGAFVTPSGQPAPGPVQLRYRYLPGPAAFLATGLTFGPATDLPQPQASLGLVEVAAWCDSQALALRPGQYIEVSLLTPPAQGAVTAALWDSSTWMPLEPHRLDTLRGEPPPVLRPASDFLTAKAAARPVPPVRPFGVRLRNTASFPEFRGYAQVYWLALSGPGNIDPWAEGLLDPAQGWEVRAARRAGDVYALTFARRQGGGVVQRLVEARPLFALRSEAEAQAFYRDKQQRYPAAYAAWLADSSRQASAAARATKQQAAHAAWLAQGGPELRTLRMPRLGIAGFLEALAPLPPFTQVTPLPDSLSPLLARLVWPDYRALFALPLAGDSLYLPVAPTGATLWLADQQGRWWAGSYHGAQPLTWTLLPAPVGQASLWRSLPAPSLP